MGNKHTNKGKNQDTGSKSMVDQFTSAISKKKKSYYSQNLKPKDFGSMLGQIKVFFIE